MWVLEVMVCLASIACTDPIQALERRFVTLAKCEEAARVYEGSKMHRPQCRFEALPRKEPK